ncbi:hypothetical protein [Streptomyces sp. NPDC058457]|uniref:hypothetical protein n=1 Tax=Streptomyces sp. NPDC058457 TaxID=3346507 RepID=UPI0036460033
MLDLAALQESAQKTKTSRGESTNEAAVHELPKPKTKTTAKAEAEAAKKMAGRRPCTAQMSSPSGLAPPRTGHRVLPRRQPRRRGRRYHEDDDGFKENALHSVL